MTAFGGASRDIPLLVAVVGNTLLAIPVLLLSGFSLLIFADSSWAHLTSEELAVIASMIVGPVVGTTLLVGYWRAARGSLQRARLTWGASLAFNAVALCAAGYFVLDLPPFGILGAWALFMCVLSLHRYRAEAA